MKNLGRLIWRTIERAATGLGLIAAVLTILAVLFPGPASRQLEGLSTLLARLDGGLAQLEKRTSAIQDDTRALRDAMPTGLQLGEMFLTEDCNPAPGLMDQFFVIFWNHQAQALQDVDLVLTLPNGARRQMAAGATINANGDFTLFVQERLRPSSVCITARGATDGQRHGAVYNVLQWRVSLDLCGQSDGLGSRQLVASYVPVSNAPPQECS